LLYHILVNVLLACDISIMALEGRLGYLQKIRD